LIFSAELVTISGRLTRPILVTGCAEEINSAFVDDRSRRAWVWPRWCVVEATGPFTRAQAVAAGFAEAEIRRLLRSGRWVALRRGIYIEASMLVATECDLERRHALEVAAVLLVLDHPCVAATTSAARILGLEFLSPPANDAVVVSSGASPRRGRRDGYVVRGAALPEHHLRVRHGVPITSVGGAGRWRSEA
jgi:hypothetical protein